jgi:CheY-like chemotaxis protein
MPEMNGYEVCEALKLDEATRDIPVIFLSASDEIFDKAKAFQVGGFDYITKPFDLTEVIFRIENQLSIKQEKAFLQEKIKQGQQAEEVLQQSHALLTSVLNSCQEGIAAMQAVRESTTGEIVDFQCVVVNRVMAQFLGGKKEYRTGKFSFKKFLEQYDPSLFDKFVRVVETGDPMECNFCYQQDKTQSWHHVSAVRLGDGFSMTLYDVTQRNGRSTSRKLMNCSVQMLD